MDFLEYLLLKTTKGQYICQLAADAGEVNHVIGIDCACQAILDASEEYAIELSRDNINTCAGKFLTNMKKIVNCYELVKNIS